MLKDHIILKLMLLEGIMQNKSYGPFFWKGKSNCIKKKSIHDVLKRKRIEML